jgi:hypothetical protein
MPPSTRRRILQLTPYLDRLPKALSGGQRQRVAIGRSIVRDPKVYLFDEPLSNLDAALRVATRIEIAQLKEAMPNSTMIYVTHDQVEAMTLATASWCWPGAASPGRHAAGALRTARERIRRPVHRQPGHEPDGGRGDGHRRHDHDPAGKRRDRHGGDPDAGRRQGAEGQYRRPPRGFRADRGPTPSLPAPSRSPRPWERSRSAYTSPAMAARPRSSPSCPASTRACAARPSG